MTPSEHQSILKRIRKIELQLKQRKEPKKSRQQQMDEIKQALRKKYSNQ